MERSKRPESPKPSYLPSSESELSEADLDPESLVPRYIDLLTRIYAIQPSLFNHAPATSKKSKSRMAQDSAVDSRVRKLRKKLEPVEKDILFDSEKADTAWKAKLVELRATTAETLRRDTAMRRSEMGLNEAEGSPVSNETAERLPERSADTSDSENDGLLGDMFTTEPGTSGTQDTEGTGKASKTTRILDFGKPSGINPRRVLEETCRARFECRGPSLILSSRTNKIAK